VPQDQKNRGGGWTGALRDAGPYLSIGTSLAATVLLGVGVGYWADRALGTRPVFFLIGAGLGLFAALYQFFKTVNRKP
jgi:F0F1-type ATP synthase assembly protein I